MPTKFQNLLISSAFWSNVFDVEKKQKEISALEERVQKPASWQNQKELSLCQRRAAGLREELKNFEELKKETADLEDIFVLSKGDLKIESELEKKIESISSAIRKRTRRILFSGKYDDCSAVFSIQAGTGGRDAEDWVALLLRMYQRYCERKGFTSKILDEDFSEGGGPEGRIGIKEVIMKINGDFAYGFLKKETGTHRLVRISPFSAKKLRHTSFAKVEVLPALKEEDLKIIQLKPDELRIDTYRSSGKGGQNVNKRETAVRITHLPTGLQASCQTERLQARNKDTALNVLKAKLTALKEKEREETLERVRGKRTPADFGHQIRSYVLHPYKLVKDHRTGVETADVEAVLDGDLDKFIEAEVKLT